MSWNLKGTKTEDWQKGVVQDLNRLSYNSFLSHLRKVNLPLEASAKIVGPHLLHNSQYGIIDHLDTPDGGNVGIINHLSIVYFQKSNKMIIQINQSH